MARSFLGGEFAGGESAWWRGDWIPMHRVCQLESNFKVAVLLHHVFVNQKVA